jgi:hypothetical protein
MSNKIPFIIHCSWLSDYPLSSLAKGCLENWKKYAPYCEIRLWTSHNYDLNKNEFLKEMVKRNLWANASDYVRKDVVYQFGGIYLDLDVLFQKDPKELFDFPAFVGFERAGTSLLVNDGAGFGAEPGNTDLKELLDLYDKMKVEDMFEGDRQIYHGPNMVTDWMQKKGLVLANRQQKVGTFLVLPWDVLSPMDYQGNKSLSEQTISLHLYNNSWKNPNSNWITFEFDKYKKRHPKASLRRIKNHLWLCHPIKMFQNRFLRKHKSE